MRYEDMINGLAEEMLEKIAYEVDEEVEYEEEVVETEEEMESLAEEMYMEELQKLAGEDEEEYEEEYEEEIEKEAGIASIVSKAKGFAGKVAPKGLKNAKANKEMAEAALGTALDSANPALRKYKQEKAKVIGAGIGAAAGAAAGAGGAMAMKKKKVQEKCAGYFEEAEFLKQAAEEAYAEALMMQDAAVSLYNRFEE